MITENSRIWIEQCNYKHRLTFIINLGAVWINSWWTNAFIVASAIKVAKSISVCVQLLSSSYP